MIALDPNQTFDLTLSDEAALAPEARTVFACRYLTARQLADFDRITDQANAPTKAAVAALDARRQKQAPEVVAQLDEAAKAASLTVAEESSLLVQALAVGGVRAKNSAAALDELCTLTQLWDLCNQFGPRQRLSEIERKKSALQSASAAQAKSVGSATPVA